MGKMTAENGSDEEKKSSIRDRVGRVRKAHGKKVGAVKVLLITGAVALAGVALYLISISG